MSGGTQTHPYDQVPEAALSWFLTRPCRRKQGPEKTMAWGPRQPALDSLRPLREPQRSSGPQLPPNLSREAPRGRATKSENRTSEMPQDALGAALALSTGMCQTRLKAPLWGQGVGGL